MLSFGTWVLVASVCVAVAVIVVKATFKAQINLDTKRSLAKENSNDTALPRALRVSSPMAIAFVVAMLGIFVWASRRIAITFAGESLDTPLMWVFNGMFVIVSVTLILAFSERQVVGENVSDRTIAVLVPLYNEDPEVVETMVKALFGQSKRPDEVHVVDDGSSQGDYADVRAWFEREAQNLGIVATWTRTPNHGKRHAQVTAFKNIKSAELFVTVDSDSVLDREAILQICHPFRDARVQSVAGIILALNNRTTFLARVTNLIYVSQQLTDRSSMSRLGSVMVNSGGLAAYRSEILADNIDQYLGETYLGRQVEFSDDSFLTLWAMLKGRTVQQPSAFAFAYMPDRFSHHYRQQVRWFRGSFIRGLWRVRFMPIGSWAFLRQLLGWILLVVSSMIFIYIVLWRPIVDGISIPPEAVLVPFLIGYVQNARYISIWRSDEPASTRYLTVLLLSPFATLWNIIFLRPMRIWGALSSRKMGWNTRERIEVTV